MKKAAMLIALLVAICFHSRAQQLTINNTSCLDVDVVLLAQNSPACFASAVDISNPINVAGGGGSYVVDFSMGPYSFLVPLTFWSIGTGLNPTFWFSQANVTNACGVGTGCSVQDDYAGVFLPTCTGLPATNTFIVVSTCAGNTCSGGSCGNTITVTYSTVGLNTIIDIM